MAQDETYQTAVYAERGGNRYVAGSGGTFAVESGGSIPMADSTTINLVAGAALSMESDAVLGLVGEDINLTDMRHVLASEWGVNVNVGAGDNSVWLSVSNLPKNAGIVNILASDTMTAGSFYLTSVSAGRQVLLRCVGDLAGAFTNNKTSICVYQSGCILLGSYGEAVASLHLQTSATFDTFVLLKAIYDDVWAIVADGGTVTQS